MGWTNLRSSSCHTLSGKSVAIVVHEHLLRSTRGLATTECGYGGGITPSGIESANQAVTGDLEYSRRLSW